MSDQVKRWRDLATEAMQDRHTDRAHLGECLDNACDYIRSLESKIATLEDDAEALAHKIDDLEGCDRTSYRLNSPDLDTRITARGEPSWLQLKSP